MICPHIIYIRFLITKGIDDYNGINMKLKELELPNVTAEVIETQTKIIEEQCPPGILRQIKTKNYSSDFLTWMKEIGVDEFWKGEPRYREMYPGHDKIVQLAMDIHSDLQLRVTINGLLLKSIPVLDIIPMIVSKFSIPMKETEILLYRDFFFDPRRMRRKDWRKYLSYVNSVEKNVYFIALSEDIEAVKTELGLSARINTSESLQFLLSKAYYRAKRYLDLGTPEGDSQAREWVKIFDRLIDKYEKYKASDTADFAKTLQLEFDYLQEEFPQPDNETLLQLADQVRKQETEDPEIDDKDSGDEAGTLFNPV